MITNRDSLTNQQIQDMYLDFVNNFVTAAKWAEHYNLSKQVASEILAIASYSVTPINKIDFKQTNPHGIILNFINIWFNLEQINEGVK